MDSSLGSNLLAIIASFIAAEILSNRIAILHQPQVKTLAAGTNASLEGDISR